MTGNLPGDYFFSLNANDCTKYICNHINYIIEQNRNCVIKVLILTIASHSQRIIILAGNLLFSGVLFIKALLLLNILHMLVIFKNSPLLLISMQLLLCIIIFFQNGRSCHLGKVTYTA